MKKFLNLIGGIILFLVAYVLFLPVSILNFLVVYDKNGYFISSAISLDKYGNREFRTIFNYVLKKSDGYAFGKENETISSVLGKNQRDNTLSFVGKLLVSFLNTLDKNHCLKSIQD